MDTIKTINEALVKAEAFLTGDAVEGGSFGVKRCSSYHNVLKYPDMRLPATYNATHALILLGTYKHLEKEKIEQLLSFFNSYQKDDGYYQMGQMKDDQVWKGHDLDYTWQYIKFHVTNYTYGAVKSLGGECRYPISFIKPYMDLEQLGVWLDKRDLTDPWLEGNNIVNIASFLIGELENKDQNLLKEIGDLLIGWHNRHQDPLTGYWGTNHPVNPVGCLEGMAGAAHNYHIYYYFNREIPYVEKIVDYCLDFIKSGVRSACLDIDVVDVLANMLPYRYRHDEIIDGLACFANRLTAFQNDDGGFADEKSKGVRRMDGWVGGYFEPQGLSNCFATWFRTATLAMIACALEPEINRKFQFRNTIGIGYFNKDYLK